MLNASRHRATSNKCPGRRVCSAAAAVERILWVDGRTHCRCLGPVWIALTDTVFEFARDGFKRGRTLAIVINLQQLQGNFMAALVATERFFQNFFSLCITTIGDVNIGFGERIYFIGVDTARTSFVKIGEERAIARINQSATFITGNSIRFQIARHDR